MRIVVLGGAGAMGQVAARDLASSAPVKQVLIADLSLERAQAVKQQIGSDKIACAKVDINDQSCLAECFQGALVVINSTPYKFNLQVMQAALTAGCHYLDLGGLFHTTLKQLELHDAFAKRGLLAVLGMGAAPGMTNVMAAHAVSQLDEVTTIDMIVGGVDFSPCAHPFLPPYALDTILDEYALPPMVFEDGQLQAKPPMSGEALFELPAPVGRVRAFLTLHSEIATLPSTYKEKGIQRVTYRLGLPEEFHERAKFLVELGMGGTEALIVDGAAVYPRRMLAALIAAHPQPDAEPDDCEAVVVDVQGKRQGRQVTVRMQSVIRSHPQWKISCGALDTGVPPSVVAQMIASGAIAARGVLPPELCVPPEPFFAALCERGIPMRRLIDEDLSAKRQCVPSHS